jgi:hypothetical protein
MACSYNLFDVLPTAVEGATANPDTGGNWFITAAPSFPVTLNINGVDESLANGNAVGSSDAPVVIFDDVPSGNYTFTYTVTGGAACTDSAEVTVIVVDGVLAGQTINITKCDTDNVNYVLYSILEGGVSPDGGGAWLSPPQNNGNVTPPNLPAITGQWTGSISSPGYSGGASATEATFNPSLHTGTEATFTYTVTNTEGNPGCTNCTNQATITFTITETPFAGDDTTLTVCNDPTA